MSGLRLVGARLLGPSGGVLKEEALAVDGRGVVRGLGTAAELAKRFGRLKEKRVNGLLTPGLFNLHTHLDLSWAAGRVSGGKGLYEWILALRRLPPPAPAAQRRAAVAALRRAKKNGTCYIVDVGGSKVGAEALAEVGVNGVALMEIMGRDPELALSRLEAVNGLPVTPHAPYSLHQSAWPAVIAAAQRSPVVSLHYGESPNEAADWRGEDQTTRNFLKALGVDCRVQAGVAEGPLSLLKRTRRPRLAVHAQHAEAYGEPLWQGALPVLCPRSAAHLGAMPRDPSDLKQFALGTDSLASCPDVNIAREGAALLAAYPGVHEKQVWKALTVWPARYVKAEGMGELAEGASPGVVWFKGRSDDEDLLRRALTWPSELLIDSGRERSKT